MSGLDAGVEKLRSEGAGAAAVASFRHYYELLESGDEGMLAESDIEPVADVPSVDDLPAAADKDVLDRAVVLKLNGGLGTSMGMTKAKSLLEVRDGQSFLDIIVRQVLELRERTGARLPLVLMNSFATREDSLAALAEHPEIGADVPADFLQNKVPKLTADDLEPVEWPADPGLEWAPPGHGDLYTALVTSGMLEELLGAGYRYAFVSNSDNLGAVLEPRILGWIAREEIPFCMEVADRTAADRKGGHLAQRPDGGLVLREIAQTPDADVEAFQDTGRHRFFNTNTLWVDLHALREVIDARDGVLGLPMIVNRKTVDPSDKSSPPVVQLETAMGAAIDVFEGARALRVDRARFAPVKTTDDLLALRSDAYELTDDARVVLVGGRDDAPHVTLDPDHYKLLADFDARFPHGAPSLRECEALTVEGDVTFGRDVVVKGRVEIHGPRRVADGEVFA
ncbi:MAG: UTP--glucose-1-phosphate uridylyltransferase [Actinomycetota bacterium]|nr:UTP--glucose-1-phosphate uridylyltransferase [Actinomycetota bacterium]